jgi:DNA-binding transcriptional regulator YhcF (GntR family)
VDPQDRHEDEGRKPIYAQIVEWIKRRVASGELQPREELDPIRVLADQWGVNAGTVVRAYNELEHQRIVESRSTKGTFVTDKAPSYVAQENRFRLTRMVDRLVAEATSQGADPDAIIELVRQRFAGR